MTDKKKTRPTYRKRKRVPRSTAMRKHYCAEHYTRRYGGNPRVRSIEGRPPEGWYMPDDRREPTHIKDVVKILAAILGGFALLEGISWLIFLSQRGW